MTADESFSSKIFGKEYARKEKAFENAMAEIELKHIDVFKEREPKFPREEHDHIFHHYSLYTRPLQIAFTITNDSDLPVNIKREMTEAFERIWSSDNAS
jgi:hypothetical protein